MSKYVRKLVLATAVCFLSVLSWASDGRELRVLFIGNSLTYTNDLPRLSAALASATGKVRLQVGSVAEPNFSLEDHWNKGDAVRAIQQAKWDVVVLQQGPSGLESSRVLLVEYARKFGEVIRKSGATPALLAVWPSMQRNGDFDRVIESYRVAAAEVHGIFLPAGAAWNSIGRDRLPELYGQDGFHPSVEGSYLAALVVVGKLCGCSVAELGTTDARSRWGIDADRDKLLRRSAQAALDKNR